MSIDELKALLLWTTAINYGVIFLWFGVFVLCHDRVYRLHSRWFRLSVESFDTLNYAGVAVYKIGVVLLNLVPLVALHAIS